MSADVLPLPRPATAAGRAAAQHPRAIVHIGCPNREVSLCRTASRGDVGSYEIAAFPNCIVCIELANRQTCPDCGADHRLPEAC